MVILRTRKWLEDALAAARKIYPAASYRLGVPLFALARADLALERNVDAENLLREALAVREPPYAANSLVFSKWKSKWSKRWRKRQGGGGKGARIENSTAADKESSRYVAELRERSTR